MENKLQKNIQEWLSLNNQGLFIEAKDLYFNSLFDDIINNFVDNTSEKYKCEVLFSVLGYTPEPIILTQRALSPQVHVIFTTRKDYESDNEIVSYLEKFLTSNFKIINLDDDEFITVYEVLKTQMNLYPSKKITIDITGGKKSLVASVAIFGRDYNCDIVYVDYDEYIPELRRPMPGTEKLKVVYSSPQDIVNTITVQYQSRPSNVIDDSEKAINQIKFNSALGQTMKNKYVAKARCVIEPKSERSFIIKHTESNDSITLQRAQLYHFFCDCRKGKESAKHFIKETSVQAGKLNPAIYSVLNNVNYLLYGEFFN